MANLVGDFAERFKGNAMLIFWPLTLVVFLMCMYLAREDMLTTVEGYKLIGTAKVSDVNTLAWVIAVLLWLSPNVLAFWYMRNTNMWYLVVISLGLWLLDAIFDMNMKVTGYGDNPTISNYATTLIDSVGVYTGGSDVMSSLSISFLWQGLPEFSKQVKLFIPVMIGLFADIMDGTLTGSKKITNVAQRHFLDSADSQDSDDTATTNNGKKNNNFMGANR